MGSGPHNAVAHSGRICHTTSSVRIAGLSSRSGGLSTVGEVSSARGGLSISSNHAPLTAGSSRRRWQACRRDPHLRYAASNGSCDMRGGRRVVQSDLEAIKEGLRETLRELTALDGVAGQETAVVRDLKERFAALAAEATADRRGHVLATKRGEGPPPVISPHSAEIGGLVTGRPMGGAI